MATKTHQPSIPVTEIEHSAFCRTEDQLPAKTLAEEQAVNIRWQNIPAEYLNCPVEELDQQSEFGWKLILGFHMHSGLWCLCAIYDDDEYLNDHDTIVRSPLGCVR